MSLTDDELEKWRFYANAKPSVERTVLEGNLGAYLNKAIDEIADLKRRLAEADRQSAREVEMATEQMRLYEKARAEAAALREALGRVHSSVVQGVDLRCDIGDDENCDHCVVMGTIEAALSQPGPGAALLAEVTKLRATAAAARDAESMMEHARQEGVRSLMQPAYQDLWHAAHQTLRLRLAALEDKP